MYIHLYNWSHTVWLFCIFLGVFLASQVLFIIKVLWWTIMKKKIITLSLPSCNVVYYFGVFLDILFFPLIFFSFIIIFESQLYSKNFLLYNCYYSVLYNFGKVFVLWLPIILKVRESLLSFYLEVWVFCMSTNMFIFGNQLFQIWNFILQNNMKSII